MSAITEKDVRFYSKDKNGNYVQIPLSRYSIHELLQKNLVHRIEIDSNGVSLNDAILNRHRYCRNYDPCSFDYLPEIIYGIDVDSPAPLGVDVLVVTSIVFKTTKNLSLRNFFSKLTNLITVQKFVAQNIVNTSSMFSDCSKLKDFPVLDTSHVTDMNKMFMGCKSMRKAPILDTSNVTNMESMFENCVCLKDIPKYKTVNVLSMSKIFKGCLSLSGKISCSNLLSCKNISGMFDSCDNIENLELSQTDNVTDFSDLCSKCTKLKKATISNTHLGNNFSNMFAGCTALESVSVFDFSEAEDCRRMFFDCAQITSFISNNANKIKTIDEMFSGCQNLHSFDIGDYINIKAQTNTFLNCLNIDIKEIHLKLSELPPDSLYQKINTVIDTTYGDLPKDIRNINFRRCDITEKVLKHKNLKYIELPQDCSLALRDNSLYEKEREYCYDKLLYIDPIAITTGTYTYTTSRRFLHEWDDEEHTGHYLEISFEDRYKYFRKRDEIRNKVYDDFLKSHCADTKIDSENNLFFESVKKNLIDKVDFYADDTLIEEHNPNRLLSLLNSKKINKIVVKDNFVMLDVLFGTDEIEELPSIVVADSVVSCRGLFSDLRKLKTIESISFLSEKLEDVTALFLNCESLVSIPSLNFMDVTVLDYIFSGCSSLERTPSIVWSQKSTDLISMFRAFENCKALKYVYNIDLNGRVISDVNGFFMGCCSLASYMPLSIRENSYSSDIFGVIKHRESHTWGGCYSTDKSRDNPYYNEIFVEETYYKNNDLIKKMLSYGSSDVFGEFALEHEVEFSSIEELQPSECPNIGIVRGIIDGTNPKYGIFVKIPSKQTTGLIHISKLKPEQKNNLSDFNKGDTVLVKIIREKSDHKLELVLID